MDAFPPIPLIVTSANPKNSVTAVYGVWEDQVPSRPVTPEVEEPLGLLSALVVCFLVALACLKETVVSTTLAAYIVGWLAITKFHYSRFEALALVGLAVFFLVPWLVLATNAFFVLVLGSKRVASETLDNVCLPFQILGGAMWVYIILMTLFFG